jgi:hypothetical protein
MNAHNLEAEPLQIIDIIAKRRKVPSSISRWYLWNFYSHNSPGSTMTYAVAVMSTRNSSWGVNVADAKG